MFDLSLKGVNRYSSGIHILVWWIYVIIQAMIYSNFQSIEVAFARALLSTLLHACFFYLHVFVLIPRLLRKDKIPLYVLCLVTSLLVLLGSNTLLEMRSIMHHLSNLAEQSQGPLPKGAMMPRKIREAGWFFLLMRNMLWFVIVYLVSLLYVNRRESIAREQQEAQLKGERLESEMKLLKTQINPHFLFNTLNNLYSLSRIDAARTPDLILRLSELLRYNLYECGKARVSLGQEVAYIESFIEFQQLKTPGEQQISLEISEADQSAQIAPLLLVPLIENSFKHGYIEDVANGWVKMRLQTTTEEIRFEISNSLPKKPIVKDGVGGIGLDNLRRRLQLEYPDQHLLQISPGEASFHVTLTLNRH